MTDDGDALRESLASLRGEGAWRIDPARFRYLEALAGRLDGQPPAVRSLLLARLHAGIADYAARFAARPPAGPAAVAGGEGTACVPLAQLNHHIRTARPAAATDAFGAASDPHELDSARRFRQAWSSGRTRDQLEQAVSRRPANAGPLNSHALVLQSLALMGELSSDYLRRFLAQVETLQWLERAADAPRPSAGKAARTAGRMPARRKPPGRGA